ncbi:protein rolling stone-like isoform X2 [Lineus longissimus]|uniref:protein rolling stone-like isoform X2 n=1 Tax=Lineus longissimus TaxID=88925 RepID=UPI002B4F340C
MTKASSTWTPDRPAASASSSQDSLSSPRPNWRVHRTFGLGFKTPLDFVRAQWPCSPLLYLLYNIFWMLYIPSWAVLEGVINFHLKFKADLWRQATFFIYLTNWTYVLLSLLALLRGFTACRYYNMLRKQGYKDEAVFPERKMPTIFKIIWVLHNVASPAQVMVGAAYYLHAAILGAMDRTTPLSDPMNISIHGIGTVYVLLDLFISAIPLRPGHVIHVMFYGLLYAAFTGIYFACGGKNKSGHPWIYRLLDWSHPRTTLMVAGAVGVLTPVVWFALYGFYRLKTYVASKCASCRDKSYSLGPEMVKQADEKSSVASFDEAKSCASDLLKEGGMS